MNGLLAVIARGAGSEHWFSAQPKVPNEGEFVFAGTANVVALLNVEETTEAWLESYSSLRRALE